MSIQEVIQELQGELVRIDNAIQALEHIPVEGRVRHVRRWGRSKEPGRPGGRPRRSRFQAGMHRRRGASPVGEARSGSQPAD